MNRIADLIREVPRELRLPTSTAFQPSPFRPAKPARGRYKAVPAMEPRPGCLVPVYPRNWVQIGKSFRDGHSECQNCGGREGDAVLNSDGTPALSIGYQQKKYFALQAAHLTSHPDCVDYLGALCDTCHRELDKLHQESGKFLTTVMELVSLGTKLSELERLMHLHIEHHGVLDLPPTTVDVVILRALIERGPMSAEEITARMPQLLPGIVFTYIHGGSARPEELREIVRASLKRLYMRSVMPAGYIEHHRETGVILPPASRAILPVDGRWVAQLDTLATPHDGRGLQRETPWTYVKTRKEDREVVAQRVIAEKNAQKYGVAI